MDVHVELERARRENQLLVRLLALADETDVGALLSEALPIIVEATGSTIGYLEIHDLTSDSDGPDWYIAHGVPSSDVESLRKLVSRGIIARAMATEQTIDTPAALLDPRFSERLSVQVGRIEAVLCVPIGSSPASGALYLQGEEEAGPFDDHSRGAAETFALQIARQVSRILAQASARETEDPTALWRARVDARPIVGRSRAVANLLQEISHISALDVGVLLTGESGTGKSLVARVIHDNSKRKGEAFVQLNCGAIPEGLVESELFGAVAGGHSTATKRMHGKVAAAERGTLFLDEIGELQPAAQAKLLQLLQSREYFPIGADRPERANIRVIAATNTDLQSLMEKGRFRADLYYRLHVLPVRTPSLSERPEDIPELASHFAVLASETHGLPRFEFSSKAAEALRYTEWPGNIRQLGHCVEAAVVRAAGCSDRRIELRHVFPDRASEGGDADGSPNFQDATRSFQANLLARTLAETGWNVSETSRRLELARSHVYSLIRAFGIERH